MSLKNNESVAAQNQKAEITASDIKESRPAKAETAEPAAKKGSSGGRLKRWGQRVAKWFRELKSELKKIVWPGKKTVVKNTGVVLMVILVVGAAVWIIDAVCEYVILNGLLKLIAG